MLDIHELPADALQQVEDFYRATGYDSPLDDGDSVVVAEQAGEIVAALRLCTTQGVRVLRGMMVRADCRRRGIGAALLQAAVERLDGRTCYCIPYSPLRDFYSRAGFRELDPESAPEFLRERLEIYRSKLDLDVILMAIGATGERG